MTPPLTGKVSAHFEPNCEPMIARWWEKFSISSLSTNVAPASVPWPSGVCILSAIRPDRQEHNRRMLFGVRRCGIHDRDFRRAGAGLDAR